ncbi:MAG: ATPase, T2SS/T4P/T4SS family [Candidatus Woesearchaeota archaeon]
MAENGNTSSSGQNQKNATGTSNNQKKKEDYHGMGKYEVIREDEDTIIKINYEDAFSVPSIEDNENCMSRVVDILTQVKGATKIIFFQKRDYEYDYTQTRMLHEIASQYTRFIKEKKLFSLVNLGSDSYGSRAYYEIQKIIFDKLKKDPVGAFVELVRIRRREKINLDNTSGKNQKDRIRKYIETLNEAISALERTRLIIIAKPYLQGFKIGDREVYRQIFNPTIKPDFMHTRLMSAYPRDGIEIDSYMIGGTEVTIFDLPGNVQNLYHITPPEFKLEEEEYEILDSARNILSEHQPEKNDFVNPERMREVFLNVGIDLITELGAQRELNLEDDKIKELAEILVRYTVGFGLVEVLLQDEEMQDISVNSPLGHVPIYIVHGTHGDCVTNILPAKSESESWASKLRLMSGRPLDEANQILDTELELPGASVRVSAITEPLDPTGLAFSFRKHRDKPWTLTLFIKNKTISPLAAGLISFLIDGTRSILICGTRGSGKSSLLSSVMIEIMRRYRIITIEDTLELPTPAMRKLGFNIQPMKVASALAKGSNEMPADDGIRSTLRLGDSSLIVGEVRSTEAKALYEAMRVGAAANVVSGTIHGDSPYGIYDRVVNDIGVPKTSFKATDICIIVNPIKSADGLHRIRRVTQITEVRKDWEEDPNTEGGFVDLMKYNADTDTLEPTDELINGNSEILKMIAANIKDFAGNWDALWENIETRAKVKEDQAKKAEEIGDDNILEADFGIKCNDIFHKVTEEVKKNTGKIDHSEIYARWKDWFDKEIRKRERLKQEKQETEEETAQREKELEMNPDRIEDQIYGTDQVSLE